MRQEITLRAPAKINWSLSVMGKREDGYHELRSLMQNVSLYDIVRLRQADADACFSAPDVCPAADNLALRAWLLLKEKYRLADHLHISIEKNIPARAGLAGGSADGAAVLLGANELFDLGIPFADLAELAFSLGADMPFCLLGGLAQVSGAGENTVRCANGVSYELLLVSPGVGLDTGAVFREYDALAVAPAAPCFELLLPALLTGDRQGIKEHMANMLAPAAERLCPAVGELRQLLDDAGAVALMSGSGSCIWALPPEAPRDSAALKSLLMEKGAACYNASSIFTGIEIMDR